MKNKIQSLASDLRPFKIADRPLVFLAKWALVFSLLTAAAFGLLPLKPGISELSGQNVFQMEAVLWFLLSLTAGMGVYFSSFPQYQTTKIRFVTFLFFSALLISCLYRTVGSEELNFVREFDLWRGRCGFLILGASVPFSVFLGSWSRKLASPNPAMTGAFAALSAASLGCFLMQFVCLHDQAMHLMLWHFLPLMLISTAGAYFGRKLFHW